MLKIALCVFLSFSISGCLTTFDPIRNNSGDNEKNIQHKYMDIVTNKSIYSQSKNESIIVTAINISNQNLYYWWPSFFASLQIRKGNTWVDLGTWYDIIALAPAKLSIAPGDTVHVPVLNSNEWIIKDLGKYRISLEIFNDPNLKQLISIKYRVSNIFEIIN